MAHPELLQKAIDAHGGVDRFRSADGLRVELSAGGFAFATRFQGRAFRDLEGHISTSEIRTTLAPFPGPGKRGVFEPDRVRIESEDGQVLAERDNPRAAFRGIRRNLWWDDLDILYFGGYALWSYLSAPFVFSEPGFEVEEEEPWEEQGEHWRRLRVLYPADFPTHSREQCFYFDDSGLLRRLDYTAELFGGWAKAAHYCSDHKEFDGFVVPTRRKVFPRRRNNRPRSRPVLVWIEVRSVEAVSATA